MPAGTPPAKMAAMSAMNHCGQLVPMMATPAPGSSPSLIIPRAARRDLVEALVDLRLPITGDLGFRKAEVTAGGIPLGELDLKTMESRRCPGVHLAGEVLDVDGRIGGFNFQWAWASGWVAGAAAARACAPAG